MLTPSILVTTENENVLCLENVHIATYLDSIEVSSPADYLTIFDVAFPNELNKTLSFLAGHVCELMPFKVSSSLQKVINVLYN